MPSDEPQTEPAEEAGRPSPDSEKAETPPRSAQTPQAPAALGGMGSTGPITVVRKNS